MTKRLTVLAVSLLALGSLSVTSDALAAPKGTAARQAAKVAAKKAQQFVQTFKRLSAADKLAVLKALEADKAKFADSDSDGLPDLLEAAYGGNVCDSDTDDDGLLDGSEVEDSGNPADDDSDDDGVKDSLELHRTGSVIAVTPEGLVTVSGSDQFQLTDTTVFKHITREEIVVGACVEIEGHLPAPDAIALADKVGEEDHCDGGGHH